MRTVAVVQARMGSTRLPGKSLAPVAGRPLLALLLERLARAALDDVVVATSTLPGDDVVAAAAAAAGVRAVRGSERDVLDRFHAAARALDADVVVRVTADCPLLDPALVDRLVALRTAEGLDYAALPTGDPSTWPGLLRWPDGLDAEAMTRATLQAAWEEAIEPYDREHVTLFIKARPGRFAAGWLEPDEDLGHERWTVDHPADLAFVRRVVERMEGTAFGYADVLALLARDPGLRVSARD
jgi:spore coat polysaccharide biosynthesis protein SpsF (cytidylyltransferase family)